MPKENWKRVLREGYFPLLSLEDLRTTLKALVEDDQRLIQGETTSPGAARENLQRDVQGCCLVSFPGWKSGLQTVDEVEEYFARVCRQIDDVLGTGNIAECRWLLNWFDETPRDVMRQELTREFSEEIQWRRFSGKE